MNSLQFSPFKGEIFACFTFLRFFLGEKDKNYSCNGEFFEILIFYPLRVNFLHFLLFKDVFFAISTVKGEFFLIFIL